MTFVSGATTVGRGFELAAPTKARLAVRYGHRQAPVAREALAAPATRGRCGCAFSAAKNGIGKRPEWST